MRNEFRGAFEGLGYDVNSRETKRGAMFFGDLVGDVCELLGEGKTDAEIRELLPNYYVEYYHFVYEIGRNKYFEEMRNFCASRVVTGEDKEMIPTGSIEDSLLYFAKRFTNSEKKNKDAKVKVNLIDNVTVAQ